MISLGDVESIHLFIHLNFVLTKISTFFFHLKKKIFSKIVKKDYPNPPPSIMLSCYLHHNFGLSSGLRLAKFLIHLLFFKIGFGIGSNSGNSSALKNEFTQIRYLDNKLIIIGSGALIIGSGALIASFPKSAESEFG